MWHEDSPDGFKATQSSSGSRTWPSFFSFWFNVTVKLLPTKQSRACTHSIIEQNSKSALRIITCGVRSPTIKCLGWNTSPQVSRLTHTIEHCFQCSFLSQSENFMTCVCVQSCMCVHAPHSQTFTACVCLHGSIWVWLGEVTGIS